MRRSLLLLPLLMLAACGSEEPREEGQSVVARTSESELPGWLTPTDGTDPARWLAGREAGRALADDAPEVAAMRVSLKAARTGFVEDMRMMANRTVQLGQMLAEIGKPEPYRRLIDGLGGIAGQRGRHKSLYGEMVQHYYNARAQGADHEAALAQLASHDIRVTPQP